MSKDNKVLVCIIGNLRGGVIPFQTLKKYVLDYYHADLAICYSQPGYSIMKDTEINIWKSNAKYDWEFKEPNDWEEIWDLYGTDWRKQLGNPLCGDRAWGGIAGRPNSATFCIQPALRHLLKIHMMKDHVIDKYTHFIITRSDHVYVNSSFPELDNKVHIPNGEEYDGYCDRFMIVPKEYIHHFLNVMESVNDGYLFSGPEKLIKDTCDNNKIAVNIFQRNMFILMRKLEHSRWHKPQHGVRLFKKYFAKYSNEYHLIQKYYHKDFDTFLKDYKES